MKLSVDVAVDGVSEHEISLVKVLAHEVKSHVDAGHEILVPHKGVSKVAAKKGSGRSEDCVEPQNLKHCYRYVRSRTESEFPVQREIPQYGTQERDEVTWPIAPSSDFIQQSKGSDFDKSGTGREKCEFYESYVFFHYIGFIEANIHKNHL